MPIWTPRVLRCRVCGTGFPLHHVERFQRHIETCVTRHADFVDRFRPVEVFEGDPELGLFARTEGDVHNRRPGTRKQAR